MYFPLNVQINCLDWLNTNTVKVKGGKGERLISPFLIPRLPPLVKDNCFFAVISMPLKCWEPQESIIEQLEMKAGNVRRGSATLSRFII